MTREEKYTIRVQDDGPDGLWAEVLELPGCFASGRDPRELQEALLEAIALYLSTPTTRVRVTPNEPLFPRDVEASFLVTA